MPRGRRWSRLDLTRACAGSQLAAAIANVATRPASASQCEREIRAEPIAAPPATESRIPVGRVNPEFGALAVIGMPQFAEITRDNHDGGARGRGCSRGGARLRGKWNQRERLIRFGSSAYRTPPALTTGPV